MLEWSLTQFLSALIVAALSGTLAILLIQHDPAFFIYPFAVAGVARLAAALAVKKESVARPAGEILGWLAAMGLVFVAGIATSAGGGVVFRTVVMGLIAASYALVFLAMGRLRLAAVAATLMLFGFIAAAKMSRFGLEL